MNLLRVYSNDDPNIPSCSNTVTLAAFDLNTSGDTNFSPDLFEEMNMSINVVNHLQPILGDYYLVARAVRGLNNGTDQLVEWMKFSGGQLAHSLDAASIPVTWDGVLTENNLPASVGPDTFMGVNANGQPSVLNRQLPSALIGETVPLPFFDVLVTLWYRREPGSLAMPIKMIRHRVHVPQVVFVTFQSPADEQYGRAVYDDEGLVCIWPWEPMIGVGDIIEYMQERYPKGMNVRYVNGDDTPDALRSHSGNVKNVYIVSEAPDSNLEENWGYAMNGADGNRNRSGIAFINLNSIFSSMKEEYDKKRAKDIPHYDAMYNYPDTNNGLGFSSIHETTHLFGVVSSTYLGGIRSHNPPSNNVYYMNSGGNLSLNVRLGKAPVTFKPLNAAYLVFILPKPSEGED